MRASHDVCSSLLVAFEDLVSRRTSSQALQFDLLVKLLLLEQEVKLLVGGSRNRRFIVRNMSRVVWIYVWKPMFSGLMITLGLDDRGLYRGWSPED